MYEGLRESVLSARERTIDRSILWARSSETDSTRLKGAGGVSRPALPTIGRLGVLAAVLLGLGCGLGDLELGEDPSLGVLGVAQFSWSGESCLFGCDAEEPVATGSIAILRVKNAASLPTFLVTVDDPQVALVSGTSQIAVTALRAGQVRLRLEQVSDGSTLDEFVITVADVARISGPSELLIAVGGSVAQTFTLFDGAGRVLAGVGALSFRASPSLDHQGQLALTNGCPEVQYEECVALFARQRGVGLLEIEAVTGAARAIVVELVDESAVTDIRLDLTRGGGNATVRRTAFVGGRVLLGPRCRWSLSPSSGPLYISDEDRDFARIRAFASQGGSATVTCVIDSLARSIVVQL